jgi:ABC-2 type transport system permease protein
MRKMLVIASREYQAAVRTKTFIISLVILPVMMLGSILMQWLLRGFVDTGDKKFVLVHHGRSMELVNFIRAKVEEYNQKEIFHPVTKKQVKPRFVVDKVLQAAPSQEALELQRYELSEDIRAGRLLGFLEIIPSAAKVWPAKKDEPAPPNHVQVFLRYQSNRPTFVDFSRFVEIEVTKKVQSTLAQKDGLNESKTQALLHPVELESKGLSRRDSRTGKIEDASEQSRFAPVIVPAAMMLLMFMVVMMTATPFMQSVVEEKMQRIAEVLLGSARPFELMMGKLIGMVGVSLTIAAVYLGGAYWAADRFGFADSISVELLLWFIVFQTLAGLMFGSLFIAIGAACTDMKETQNLMWPVMLLVCLPLFLMGTVLQEPNSAVARWISFFPFATPTLMIARISVPPGLPWWEPAVAVTIVLATTVACVWAAGRIFRVGILLQGKGARIGQICKWILRG